MSIGVAKVTRVDTPGAVVWLISDCRTGRLGLCQQCVYLVLAGHGVTEAELSCLWRTELDTGILRQLTAWIQSQKQTTLQLKQCDGSGRRSLIPHPLRANHTARGEPKTVTIERECPIEITDSKCDYINPSIHSWSFS